MLIIEINVETGEQTERELTADELAAIQSIPPAPKIIPTLNPDQIRMQLSKLGLRDQVEQAVANGNQDLKDLWEYAPVFKIDDQNIQALAAQLGVNQAQLEQLFIDGAQL